MTIITLRFINPLNANVEYTSHGGDVICSGCGASYREKLLKWPPWAREGENLLQNGILHFLQNGILHFVFKLSQSSGNRVTKLEFTQTKN